PRARSRSRASEGVRTMGTARRSGDVGDDPARKVAKEPFDEQRPAVAHADELHEVVRAPHRPRRETREHDAHRPRELRAGLGASERDEVALTVVPERLDRLAADEM